jgi:phage repressor protein C with HTH and peptisase S24 domain
MRVIMQMPQLVNDDDPYGIKARREARGWSQQELADRANEFLTAEEKRRGMRVKKQDVGRLEKTSDIKKKPVNSMYKGVVISALNAPDDEPRLALAERGGPRLVPASKNDVPLFDVWIDPKTGESGLSPSAIGTIPRPPLLAHATQAYCVQVRGVDMSPVYRPGDTLAIDPNRVPRTESGVVLVSEDHKIVIGEFVSETAEKWELKKYGAQPETISVSRERFPACHCIAIIYPGR